MPPRVLCVPNFSEGRRPDVIEAIAEAIRAVADVYLLDVSSDVDHNRTVMTFLAEPAGAVAAAFAAISVAAQRIDLDRHQGVHPRIGATDVCPFVPFQDMTMADCVELCRRLGRRVGAELGIAVYLYGAAATRPERKRLADIRRGEYEGWKATVSGDPAWVPDFGPAAPAPWGATVIGARPPLIAYNLYLNSNDGAIAEEIARQVRFSSGGLRHVEAKGFLVRGQAQVSMNLTAHRDTPIHRVQELVRREAARHGLTIVRGEIVGLIPQQALTEASRWYLQLDRSPDEVSLESRLARLEKPAPQTDMIPHAFLDAVAGATPTPGGGSVSALVAALGAGLCQMVAGLTVGRKRYAQVAESASQVMERAGRVRTQLTEAMAQDMVAYERWIEVARDPEPTGDRRRQALDAARRAACQVPRRVASLSREVVELAAIMGEVGNVNAATDAAVAGLLARAAVHASLLNVQTNVVGMDDQEVARAWIEEVRAILQEVEAAVAAMEATVSRRVGAAD